MNSELKLDLINYNIPCLIKTQFHIRLSKSNLQLEIIQKDNDYGEEYITVSEITNNFLYNIIPLNDSVYGKSR